MSRWLRVFGTNQAQPAPEALLEELQACGQGVAADFRGDDQGWLHAGLRVGPLVIELERYLSTEEGIRAELNTWAAWLESMEEDRDLGPLMQLVISTTQLFTLQVPDDRFPGSPLEAVALGACRYLAKVTAGVYQVDDQGFFGPDGRLLVAE